MVSVEMVFLLHLLTEEILWHGHVHNKMKQLTIEASKTTQDVQGSEC